MNIKVEKFLKFSWLILFPFIITFSVKAAEWSVGANVNQNISYDDNVKMRENDKEESLIYSVSPVINLTHKTDVSEISASASYGFEHFFSGISGLNRDRHTQKYGLKGHYVMTERLGWGLSSDYSIAPGRDTADTGDGNGFFGESEKTLFSISPSVSYQLTEQDEIMLSGGYTDASYDIDNPNDIRGEDNFPSDYETIFISLGWSRSWSERFTTSIGASVSKYESTRKFGNSLSTTSDSAELTVSLSYMLSEIWELYGEVGGRVTETEFNRGRNVDTNAGHVFDIGTIYTGENLTTDFSISQSLMPSSQGQEEDQFKINLEMGYKITERLSTAFVADYQEREPTRGGSSEKRTNFSIQPSLSWRLNPDWTISTSYRYRYQERPVDNLLGLRVAEEASSNLYMISLNYRWQGLSISR